MQLGPESILVAVRVDFRDDVTAANVERSPLSFRFKPVACGGAVGRGSW
jgi:hypothetical protein